MDIDNKIKNKVANLKQHIPQIATSFPSKNSKRIDYVITYKIISGKKDKEEKEKEKLRKLFLEQVEKEELEYKRLKRF